MPNSQLQHPAVIANIQSTSLAAKGDKAAWLALYAEDALLKDPVGISPLEPSGEGHKGKKAIASFWDRIIAPSNITIKVEKRIISGPRSCAVVQEISNNMGNGKTSTVDMIACYEVDDAGLITQMLAYWDFDALMQQLA